MNKTTPDITITSIETITAFDIATGDFMFTLDELQNATLSQSEEKSDITGKQGRKLNSLKRNKAVKISGTNGLISAGLMEVQTGGKFEKKETEILWTDYLTVQNGKAITEFKAVGTAGNEIEKLYIKNADDNTLDKELVQAASAASGKFAYDPATKTLTFNTSDAPDGTEIVVFYNRKINGSVMENTSDTRSGKAKLYIDALGEDSCNNIYRLQIYTPKADFSGDFDLAMGENQTVHSFEAESLAGSCGLAKGMYWTYTVFDDDAKDAGATAS